MDVVLVARREELLRQIGSEIEKTHGVRTLALAQDLTAEDSSAQLESRLKQAGWKVGLLINNAGFGSYGDFLDSDEAFEARMVDLNCRTCVSLTRRFAPAMVERGRGGIIFVASMAGYQPLPYLATYGATKAFALSFAEALWAELRSTGVDVLALCPGYVDTGFQAVADSASMPKMGEVLTPTQVVNTALNALGRKPSVVPGLRNKFLAFSPRVGPRKFVVSATAKMFKPKA
jgi:short-subunit dehydrogenase